MKTAVFALSLLSAAVGFAGEAEPVRPRERTGRITLEADARLSVPFSGVVRPELRALALSGRKSFADRTGDRFLLFGILEAEENLRKIMLHELYGQIKGPMGRTVVTIGRFRLPYGLLRSYEVSRMPFSGVADTLPGFDADNGILVSGFAGPLLYGVAVSQGLGAHRPLAFPGNGLVTARAALASQMEDHTAGLSAYYGRLPDKTAGHDGQGEMLQPSWALGLDGSTEIGLIGLRAEVHAGARGRMPVVAGWAGWDAALFRRTSLLASVRGVSAGGNAEAGAWIGLSLPGRFFTFRSGYEYGFTRHKTMEVRHDTHHHSLTLQLYSLFAFGF